MVTARELVRPTFNLFLPAVVLLMVVVPVAEPIIRGHDVLGSLRQLYLPLALAEPLLIAAGYAIGLSVLKTRLNQPMLRRRWLHLAAGVVSVVFLGVISVFSQGAHLSWIVSASLTAGVLSAVVFFGFRSLPRVAVSSCS
jgi:hypothetical protein